MFSLAAANVGPAGLSLSKRVTGCKQLPFGGGLGGGNKRIPVPLIRASPARSEFDGLFSSPLGMMEQMDREFESVQREMMQMDRMMNRDVYRMLEETQELSDQARRQAEEMARAGIPKVSIERSENYSSGNGYSRFYQHVEIYSSGGMRPLTPAHMVSSGPSSLVVAVVAILAGAYAAMAAAFNKNFDLTTFKPEARWKLLLLWPVLLLFSRNFREQFVAAVQGRKATIKDDK